MIEITLRDIVDNMQFFIDFGNKQMPAKLAYRFAKIIKVATEEYNRYQELRNKLVDKYGEKNENGEFIIVGAGHIKVNPENEVKFYKELNDLLEEKINIDVEHFNIEDIEGWEITPSQMVILEKFFQ